MQHDAHLNPNLSQLLSEQAKENEPKFEGGRIEIETLEDIQEKYFPTVSLERLAEIMPSRPRRNPRQQREQEQKELREHAMQVLDQIPAPRAVEDFAPVNAHSSFVVPTLKDSGERRQFQTGAIRDRAVGKGRFDLIATQLMFRLARHYEAGSIKYADRNWEKGMPFSVYIDAAARHLVKYIAGWNDEDHAAAIVWNIAALMFQEERNPDLDDLPERKREAVDMLKWVVRRPEDA